MLTILACSIGIALGNFVPSANTKTPTSEDLCFYTIFYGSVGVCLQPNSILFFATTGKRKIMGSAVEIISK